jgi:predicted ATPase
VNPQRTGSSGAPAVRRTNLPALPVPLIGRETDIEILPVRLLGDDRLHTLTGPGGVGKTHLAIQTAAELESHFTCGAWFAGLAGHATAESAAVAMLAALEDAGLPSAVASPMLPEVVADRVNTWLAGRRLLLVLDNLEQIPDARSLVASLLARAPGLSLLVTSRVPVGVPGEVCREVQPLATPPPSEGDPAIIAAYPAVRLFLERARAVDPAFTVDAAGMAAIGAICRRVDGLPLAIELAAARSGLLTPAVVLARLGERFTILSSEARDLPERHRSIEAAIGCSDDLLTPHERAVFHRLSVFRSPWTADSAHAVAGAGPGDLDRLASYSLLSREVDPRGGEPRYRMLEMVRAFAGERLAADDAALAAAREAHAHWFEELAAAHENRAVALHRDGYFDRNLDDLLAAIEWRQASGHPEAALRMAIHLGWYWYLRGRASLGARLLAGVEDDTCLPAPIRGRGLALLGLLQMNLGDLDGAARALHAAEALYCALGDEPGELEVREHLADLAMQRGDLAAARTLREDLLDRRRSGPGVMVASAMNNLAEVEQLDGADARAFALLADALDLCADSPDRLTRGLIQGNLASLAAAMALAGDPASPPRGVAEEHWRESLVFSRDAGDVFGVLVGLLTAALLAAPGDPARAATLLGAAEAVSKRTGIAISGVEARRCAILLEVLADSLRPDVLDHAIASGRNLEEDAAVRLALDDRLDPSCGNRVESV